MRVFAPGDVNGTFSFSPTFTQGPNPNTGGTNSGDALASLLLGYPVAGAFNVGTRNDFYTNYFAGFVQDDFRWGSNVSINVGLRYELEPGLRERNNAMVVGFDRERPFPIQAPGLDLRGGLMYAGVDGYPEHQGDPSTTELRTSRRHRVVARLEDRSARRLRALLGAAADRPGLRPGGVGDARVHGDDDIYRQHRWRVEPV